MKRIHPKTIQKETEKWLEETAIIFEICKRIKKGEKDLHKFYAEKVYGTNDDTIGARLFLTKTGKTQGTE